jgi:hypothetical protein
MRINVGRNGVFNGLFGNPVREKQASEQYRAYFRSLMTRRPTQVDWLHVQILAGVELFCPGCGVNSPTCHARIIEQELQRCK